MLVRKFDNQIVTLHCPDCNNEFKEKINKNFEFEWNTDFDQYNPIKFICPNCLNKGKKVSIFVNPNIPVGEYDEFEMEATGFIPNEEINARKYTRDIMWAHRPDLKKHDRVAKNASGSTIVKNILDKYKGTDKIKL
ncbi:hypothetical protein [Mesobacillus stamsii]|uniref:RNA-binding Zn-ribbon protein involved in translation (DUF1610 family) n=1 Tax=Mesobacillus stamsii TaxID=225347 RepID=A0ABU0FWD3_9BACI|nr:hypothetical protein [Mesobacillus stamsii]MDQ0414241.1 putative RNA-binding Zn-ribbon protein involved in translation (DUF1610 family) [Mesobacillus stamsii]